MKDAGVKFDPGVYVPRRGRLLHRAQRPDAELPFNSSTTGLPLQQGRLQGRRPRPREAPTTWPEVALAARKLKAAGHKVPLHHQLAAGRSWRASRLAQRAVRHQAQQRLQRHWTRGWPQQPAAPAPHREPGQHGQEGPVRLLQGAATTPATPPFSGECAMTTTSSGCTATSRSNAKFAGASAPALLPRRAGAPQNTVIGGASLWVMGGKKPDEYKGVAVLPTCPPRGAGARATSAPATCRSPPAYELTEKSGLLRRTPAPTSVTR